MRPRAYITVITTCVLLLAVWIGLVQLLADLGH